MKFYKFAHINAIDISTSLKINALLIINIYKTTKDITLI